jgi:hypothetical protein
MLYRSLISSRHDLIHAEREENVQRTLGEKFQTFKEILKEHFNGERYDEENYELLNNAPLHDAYQIVYNALPYQLKAIGPSAELLRCLLESLSSICFTESAAIMHIVS